MKPHRTNELKKVSDLFESYKKRLRPPQSSVVKVFVEVVDEVLNITLKPSQIEYSVVKQLLFLKTPSLLANEIKINKKELLAHLKARLGDGHGPTDIK